METNEKTIQSNRPRGAKGKFTSSFPGGLTAAVYLHLSENTIQRLKSIAAEKQLSFSSLAEQIMRDHLVKNDAVPCSSSAKPNANSGTRVDGHAETRVEQVTPNDRQESLPLPVNPFGHLEVPPPVKPLGRVRFKF